MSRRWAPLGVLLWLLVAQVAVAQPSTPAPAAEGVSAADRAVAKEAFRVGAQAFRANQFKVAAESFEEAHARDPRPETAFSIAQANRLQYYFDRIGWRVQRAVQLYQWYLERLPSGPRARDALDRLGELEPVLAELRRRGELTPYVPPVRTQLVIGAAVDRAKVSIDGVPAMLWQPVDVAEGSHEVVVEAAGYELERRRVVIAAGRFLPVDVTLRAKPGRIRVRAERGATLYVDGRQRGRLPDARPLIAPGRHLVSITRRGRAPWSGMVTVGRDQEVTVTAALAPTGQRRVARWVLGSAAVVALAAGGAEGWSFAARRDARALETRRRGLAATPADLARYNQRVEDAGQRRDLALGLGVAAAATALLGAGMWWFDHPAPGADSRFELDPVIGPEGAGAVLKARF